jgi:hypothetical protein
MRLYVDKLFSSVSVHFHWRLFALWVGIRRRWDFTAKYVRWHNYTFAHFGPFKLTVRWPNSKSRGATC